MPHMSYIDPDYMLVDAAPTFTPPPPPLWKCSRCAAEYIELYIVTWNDKLAAIFEAKLKAAMSEDKLKAAIDNQESQNFSTLA